MHAFALITDPIHRDLSDTTEEKHSPCLTIKKTAPEEGAVRQSMRHRQARGVSAFWRLAHKAERLIADRHSASRRDRKRTLDPSPTFGMTRDNASWRTQSFRWMLLHKEQPNSR